MPYLVNRLHVQIHMRLLQTATLNFLWRSTALRERVLFLPLLGLLSPAVQILVQIHLLFLSITFTRTLIILVRPMPQSQPCVLLHLRWLVSHCSGRRSQACPDCIPVMFLPCLHRR